LKLAIVDLDMVVADNTKRFENAAFMRGYWHGQLTDKLKEPLANPTNQAFIEKGLDDLLENLFWQTAFEPDLVQLDTLIEGVDEALYHLEEELGYHIVFLTSRPESMRQATREWLLKYLDESLMSWEIVMKPPAFQFVKTVTWKAGTVQMLHRLFEADELLFIDDEVANRQAILDAYPDGGDFGIVRVASSLDEAVKPS